MSDNENTEEQQSENPAAPPAGDNPPENTEPPGNPEPDAERVERQREDLDRTGAN